MSQLVRIFRQYLHNYAKILTNPAKSIQKPFNIGLTFMPDFDAYLTTLSTFQRPSGASRSIDAWLRIQDKPSSIVVRRNGSTLAAQTVRLEYASNASRIETDGETAVNSERTLVVFGVKDHPTITDTDLQHGDRFGISGDTVPRQWRIVDVIDTHGEIQATAVRVS